MHMHRQLPSNQRMGGHKSRMSDQLMLLLPTQSIGYAILQRFLDTLEREGGRFFRLMQNCLSRE